MFMDQTTQPCSRVIVKFLTKRVTGSYNPTGRKTDLFFLFNQA